MTAVTRPVRRKKPFPWKEALRILVLTLISLLMIFPIFWMISGSLKAPHEVMNKDVFWPAKPYWENYAIAWKSAPFGQYFKNSILMAPTVVICQVLTGSLAGYAFAKLPFKLSKPIFFLFLCSMMIPSEATIVSNFLTLAALRLTNTFFSVIVVSLVSMFSVFLFRQFYKTIDNALLEAAYLATVSDSIEEAAYIDGAGDLRGYWSIILPLSKSAIATVAIIGFIGNWNSYMWPKVVATKESLRTVQTGLRMLMQSDFGDDWGSIMAAATLITMPMILFFVCLQRYFVQGITKVGLK